VNGRRALGYIFFCLVAVFFVIGDAWVATGNHVTTPAQLTADAATYQIGVTQSPHGTIVVSQSYQFNPVSAHGSLTAAFAIDTPPLGLVIAAVVIVAAIIIVWRIPENKYNNMDALTTDEKQKITSLKERIEKVRSLEAEKKGLLLELDELKKVADTKVTALETEVNAPGEEVKSQQS